MTGYNTLSQLALQTTLVVTVLNEQTTIVALLESISAGTICPHQTIIVDGGSTDLTYQLLQNYPQEKATIIGLKYLQQPGNRSIGRNTAINLATTQLIAITDAGCIVARDWLEQILLRYAEAGDSVESLFSREVVVAGYYAAQSELTALQTAIVPYVLVMPDRVQPSTFLPATRSMLLPKTIWERLGGFDQRFSDNEDYEFARRLSQQKVPIVFAQHAVIFWRPVETIPKYIYMIFRFAKGDAAARLFRWKVLSVFGRYGVGIVMVVLSWLRYGSFFAVYMSLVLLLIYVLWAIMKNYRYVRHKKNALWWLPVLQIASDMAVILGTSYGLLSSIFLRNAKTWAP